MQHSSVILATMMHVCLRVCDLTQIFSTRLSESINALDGGCVTSSGTPEIVLHTFSGKV